ncbi:hypothetical protein Tco_1212986 [Tanacetum coccineum]
MTFTVMCKAYGGEPSVDLLRSFLNLGRAGDWLTLSSRGGADVPKALTKLVTHLENWKEFPSAKELKGATNCHLVIGHVTPPSWMQHLRKISIEKLCDIHYKAYMASCDTMQEREIKKDKAYAKLEKKCNEAIQDLDKNPLEVDSLRHDRAAVVSRVIPNAAMKLIRSDKMGVLIARLDKASIIYGRCTVFEEVAELNKPFVLEEMLGFRPSSNEEYDRAGNDLVDASYPFLAELTADPHACME